MQFFSSMAYLNLVDKTFDEVRRLIDYSVADLNQHIDEAEDAQANEDIKVQQTGSQ